MILTHYLLHVLLSSSLYMLIYITKSALNICSLEKKEKEKRNALLYMYLFVPPGLFLIANILLLLNFSGIQKLFYIVSCIWLTL